MDDVTFEIPTFDPDGPGIDDDYSFDLPDPPMDLPLDVQQQLNASSDNLQNLQGELKQEELETQKKRLVDSVYNEVSLKYGLCPEGRIDYSQFGIDPGGKTLYLTPEDKKISVAVTRGGFRFLAKWYGAGGTYALRRSLGFTHYRSGVSRVLGKEAVETLQSAEETLPKNIESIELKDICGATNDVIGTTRDVETALKSIEDSKMDVALVSQATRDLDGVREAMTRMRDELSNNLAKLSDVNGLKSEVEKHLARERQKLRETDDTEIQEEIRDRMRRLNGELSDIALERQARLKVLSSNRASLQSQINRIRETISRLLHEDAGWANTKTLPRAGHYHRIDSHSNWHGDIDTRACAHRWGKYASAVADSQATWQGRGIGMGKKAPTGPWACPG